MADRIVVMNHGVIVQTGTPEEIYRQPNSPFVADFVGVMNFLPGLTTDQPQRIRCHEVELIVTPDGYWSGPDQPVTLAFRPEEVQLDGGAAPLLTHISNAEFLGSFYRLKLTVANAPQLSLLADLPANFARQANLAEGSALPIHLPPDSIRVFKAEA